MCSLLYGSCHGQTVILVKTILLDDTLYGGHIPGISGIAALLDTLYPMKMVIRGILSACLIAVSHQHLRMIFHTLQRTAESTELVIIVVIVVITPRLSRILPRLAGLDAEEVVVLLCKTALAIAALHRHLCQRDACRDAIASLLLHGSRCILLKKGCLIIAHCDLLDSSLIVQVFVETLCNDRLL